MGSGFNYIREIMQMNLPEESKPKKFRFISRLKQPIINSFRRECMIEDLTTGRLRCYLASPNDVVMDGNKLYTWTGEKWQQFVPGPCTDYVGPNPYEKKIMVGTAPSIDSPLAEMIREKTNILMDQLGIGYDAPSAIEKHENMMIASWNMRYVGIAVHMPTSQHVYIRHLDTIYTKQHLAKIGDVVTYKDNEYVWTGEQWKICNPEFKLPKIKKEENKMLTGDMIRYVGQTTTALVVGSTDSSIRMVDGYHHVSAVGDIVRYKNNLFMFADDPNPQRLPHWIGLVTIASDKPNTAYHKIPAGLFVVKKVVFNDPATIVFWEDGNKTVVRCGEGDTFDPEKGLAMAFAKKALGNQGNYYNTIRELVPKPEPITHDEAWDKAAESVAEAHAKLTAGTDLDTLQSPGVYYEKKDPFGVLFDSIQELIIDMVYNGATKAELVRAIKYSKEYIDWLKTPADENTDLIELDKLKEKYGIKELKEKYHRA